MLSKRVPMSEVVGYVKHAAPYARRVASNGGPDGQHLMRLVVLSLEPLRELS